MYRPLSSSRMKVDLTEEERAFSKFSVGKVGFGSHPVLLIVDMQKEYADRNNPWYFPSATTVARKIKTVLKEFRAKNLPVIYTYNGFRRDLSDAGLFRDKSLDVKMGLVCVDGTSGVEIMKEIAPNERDIVINKKRFSAFFGTDLLIYLNGLDADTIVLTGCVTSGCIRMTAYDAFQFNYRVIIPADCVGDQTPQLHEQSLFIMDRVVADVLPSAEVISYIRKIEGPSSPLLKGN
jgi:maleamate amidohydrolase